MAGIPIFAGFFAKLFLFDQMIQSGFIALVIVAVINSIISVGYYFKIIVAMYNKESKRTHRTFCYLCSGNCSYGIEYCARCFPSFVLDLLA
jgi:NADH-quinone oxidoreductase subunit N